MRFSQSVLIVTEQTSLFPISVYFKILHHNNLPLSSTQLIFPTSSLCPHSSLSDSYNIAKLPSLSFEFQISILPPRHPNIIATATPRPATDKRFIPKQIPHSPFHNRKFILFLNSLIEGGSMRLKSLIYLTPLRHQRPLPEPATFLLFLPPLIFSHRRI
jgi:hypothetical protein